MTDQLTTTIASETAIDDAMRALEAGLRGRVLRPGDDDYDRARRVYNAMIDKRPAYIIQCEGVADIINSVKFAREHEIPLSVKGSGHNVAGHAIREGGVVIDVTRMRSVRVDPGTCTARAEPGCTWHDFDHETQAHGFATPGGIVSSTGISGLTLGGGIGWLVRKYGLSCDNLLSVDLVTADGEFLTANATTNADLYWGVRGGGGNFGVVTSFEYQLHRVGAVLGGMTLYPVALMKEVLTFYREYIATAPDELETLITLVNAPPALAEKLPSPVLVGVFVCYAGDLAQADEVLRPLRQFGPPIADHIGPMPYVALQSLFDAGSPYGFQQYWKAGFLQELSDDLIDALVKHTALIPSKRPLFQLCHLGGAMSRIAGDDTAFAHRDAAFGLNIVAAWSDEDDGEAHLRWTRDFWADIESFTTGGAYVNFLGEEGAERIRAAYGANYERLVALKQRYDPTNVFESNQNIPPRM